MRVFVEEPANTNPLFGHPSVICTPHLGASTTEAQENVALQVAEQMSDYLLTGAIVNSLNMPNVTAEEAPRLAPYLDLAEKLTDVSAGDAATPTRPEGASALAASGALTLALGVGCWAFSGLKFQADMGWLLAFLVLVNALAAITVLPAMAVILDRMLPRRRG